VQQPIDDEDDASLARRSVAGDRDAFSRIVVRYRSLVCSIAYSGTGSVSISEDTAQETPS
jgi:DNA-directed RNA polymerase specialized sigma24 family protein